MSSLLLAVVVGGGACLPPPGAACGDGWCPEGYYCAIDLDTCIKRSGCGNLIIEADEECDDGNLDDQDDCLSICRRNTCGDGKVSPRAEECDDGNLDDQDDCLSICKRNTCRDGFVDRQPPDIEICDDGDDDDTNSCYSDCSGGAGCGNGQIDRDGDGLPIEECDDGDQSSTDECVTVSQAYQCRRSRCGDGIVASEAQGVYHEECDGGSLTSTGPVETATCNFDCTLARCGDGKVNGRTGELCDDGNLTNRDGCDNNCKPTGCGNGIVTVPEVCDDGNAVNGDGCDSNCRITGCGNGVITAPEVCDDGDLASGDGCDSNCKPTGCGNGVVTAPEACDDGNVVNGDGCDSNCRPTGCGNGVVTAPEVCDDGDLASGDGCDSNCKPTGCGNGVVTAPEVCDDGNSNDNDSCLNDCTGSLLAYIKASNTRADGLFGAHVALSADGSTLAVGAPWEASAATGVGGNQADNSASRAGAVYIFVRSGTTWSQQAYIKASNTGAYDRFGDSVALSADGSTLAVGAWLEASAATGIGGNQADNSASGAGAVYVFVRSGTTWSQQAYVKASNTGTDDEFGYSVALSADGLTLAVGAVLEKSAATGIGGNQVDNSAPFAGAVYVFTRSGTTWSQQAYVKASNTGPIDKFGSSVALSANGSILAVGALFEDSAATGIDGNQADNAATDAGAVYVFTRNGTTWSQQAYVKASNTGPSDEFGHSVALSADGLTLAVGAYGEDSAAVGIGGSQADDSASSAGAVYVFTRSGTTWSQQAYIKASNTGASDYFGSSVALSADGVTLAVSAHGEDSAAIGIGGNQFDNSASEAGAIYVFARSGTMWGQQAYVKASNTGSFDRFGSSVALSADDSTLTVGAYLEASAATGIGGNQTDNSAQFAGAVYVFSGRTWLP